MSPAPTAGQLEVAREILDRIGGWWDSRPADKAAMVERVASILAQHAAQHEPGEEELSIEAIATKVIDAYEAALGTETDPYKAGADALSAALTPKGPTP